MDKGNAYGSPRLANAGRRDKGYLSERKIQVRILSQRQTADTDLKREVKVTGTRKLKVRSEALSKNADVRIPKVMKGVKDSSSTTKHPFLHRSTSKPLFLNVQPRTRSWKAQSQNPKAATGYLPSKPHPKWSLVRLFNKRSKSKKCTIPLEPHFHCEERLRLRNEKRERIDSANMSSSLALTLKRTPRSRPNRLPIEIISARLKRRSSI